MQENLITEFEKKTMKKNDLPTFRPGDTVRVHYKIKEGGGDKQKFRIQPFEGVVIRYKKGTVNSTFTVRKIGANGVGVERVFPVYSPMIDKVTIKALGRVRRSRLYYLRSLRGKAARIKSRFEKRSKEDSKK